MSNTLVASDDGVIASFMDESNFNFFTFGAPDASALMFAVMDGELNLRENHAAVPYAQYDGVGVGFTHCVDATSFAVSSCYSPQISITPTSIATPIKAPWVNPSFYQLGNPVLSPNDPARLVGVTWQFTIPPSSDGGSDTCVAEVTITNLAFYH